MRLIYAVAFSSFALAVVGCKARQFNQNSKANQNASPQGNKIRPRGKVLVVMSGEDKVLLKSGGSARAGYFLSELAVPLAKLVDAGFEITFASPGGKKPARDEVSNFKFWFTSNRDEAAPGLQFEEANALLDTPGFKSPLPLSEVKKNLEQFDALFVPGGHAPMTDLVSDKDLGEVLMHFHKEKKVTGLICHSPVALLSAKAADGSWIYKDYKVAVFSSLEETTQEKVGLFNKLRIEQKDVPAQSIWKQGPEQLSYHVDTRLKESGAIISQGLPYGSHVIKDRELITGQNPMSAAAFGATFTLALLEQLNTKPGRNGTSFQEMKELVYSSPYVGDGKSVGELEDAFRKQRLTGASIPRILESTVGVPNTVHDRNDQIVTDTGDRKSLTQQYGDVTVMRQKLFHPNGVCATGSWEITEDSNYSGLFEKGSKVRLIARLSTAGNRTEPGRHPPVVGEQRMFAVALKLFPAASEAEAVNTVNLLTFDQEGPDGNPSSWFMKNEKNTQFFSNWMFGNGPTSKLFERIYSRITPEPRFRPLTTLAAVDAQGQGKSNVVAPRFVKLVPVGKETKVAKDFRAELMQYGKGELRFEIRAFLGQNPEEMKSAKPKETKLGEVVLDAPVASPGCDQGLQFFHHTPNKSASKEAR